MRTEQETARLFYDTLIYTQWLPPGEIEAYQRGQLSQLLHHAARTTNFYAERLATVLRADGAVDWDRWHEIPILKRADVHTRRQEMISSAIPKHHGQLTSFSTSGTTGVPVTVTSTGLATLARRAAQWRGHAWHQLDWSRTSAICKGQRPGRAVWPNGRIADSWGPSWLDGRGIRHVIEQTTPIDKLVEWLGRTGASYFSASPIILNAVAEEIVTRKSQIKLDATIGFGMQTRPEYRRSLHDKLGVPIIEFYGSDECGPIAVQCPKGALHINAELVKVEIVDEEDGPCPPGVQGRVLVTVLHNAAQPLIRYELGDLASFAGPCGCGLQLPVLGPIAGRLRHMFRLAGGVRFLPSGHVTTEIVETHLHGSWYQLAQTGANKVELRFVSPAPPSEEDLENSRLAIVASLRGSPALEIVHKHFERPPLKPGQKYIEFVNEYAPPDT